MARDSCHAASGQTGSCLEGSCEFWVVRSTTAMSLAKSSARVGAGNNTDTSSAERGAIGGPGTAATAPPFVCCLWDEPPHATQAAEIVRTASLKYLGEDTP